MNKDALRALVALLQDFEDEDFGDLPAFNDGRWSRETLSAMTDDVEHCAKSVEQT